MPIIVRTLAGSRLFGTATPDSDTDYKGVYQATLDDIILGRAKDDIVHTTGGSGRNTASDVDLSYKELRKFITDCLKGQTYALEMLFTPLEYTLETSETWEYIQTHRDRLITGHFGPFVGYARNQAQKYSRKGDRYELLGQVLTILESHPPRTLLSETIASLPASKYIEVTTADNQGHPDTLVRILDRQYQTNKPLSQILPSVSKMHAKYGPRTALTQATGQDWKAWSHAVRLCGELREYLETGHITLPRPDAPFLLAIKQGQIDFKIVSQTVESTLELLDTYQSPADIEAKTHTARAYWDKWLLDLYRQG